MAMHAVALFTALTAIWRHVHCHDAVNHLTYPLGTLT